MKPRKSFLLRIDHDLYAALEEWAQQELRSVNGQIEYLLRQALLKRGRPASLTPSVREAELERPDDAAGGAAAADSPAF